jgi:hypothetical protein
MGSNNKLFSTLIFSEGKWSNKLFIKSRAAILIASKDGNGDKIWEELSVQESMKDLDSTLKEILNEKKE